MTRLINREHDQVFTALGLPEWHVDEEMNVPESLAVQLLGRGDGSFELAEGENEPEPSGDEPADVEPAAPAPPMRWASAPNADSGPVATQETASESSDGETAAQVGPPA